MTPGQMHHHASGGGVLETLLPLTLLAAAGAAYLVLAGRRRREPRGWNRWQTGAFLAGLLLLALALIPDSRRSRPAPSTGTCTSTC
jgi:putative membrane protein